MTAQLTIRRMHEPNMHGRSFLRDDSAIDGGPGGPFVALIMSQTILGHDLSMFVDRVLLLDVHRRDEDARDLGGLREG